MAGMCRKILLSRLLADGVCFREAKGGQQDPETERAEWSVQCLQPVAVLGLVSASRVAGDGPVMDT